MHEISRASTCTCACIYPRHAGKHDHIIRFSSRYRPSHSTLILTDLLLLPRQMMYEGVLAPCGVYLFMRIDGKARTVRNCCRNLFFHIVYPYY